MTTLHITNGDSAAATLRQFLTDPVAVTADPLHEGPCPADVDGDAWQALRAHFLADDSDASYEDVLRWLTESDKAIADAPRYGEVILWFEHDLFDQLLLIRTLDLLVRLKPDTTGISGATGISDIVWTSDTETSVVSGFGQTVSLICIGAFPGIERFVGLGQLNADQLASLVDRRRPVTNRHYEIAREAWKAFRSPDPTELARLMVRLKGDPTYEFLADALKRFLEEYPSTRNGMSRSADAILQALIEAPLVGHELFVRTQARYARTFMGDLTLFGLVNRLASARVPLVTIEGTTSSAGDVRRGRVALTGPGREVAAGRQDPVALSGIDEWRGGVHPSGRDRSAWRWDRRAETLLS